MANVGSCGCCRNARETPSEIFTAETFDEMDETATEEPLLTHENAHVAAGKAISFLLKMEHHGSCGVERRSVYGAAVAIPQIARSVGWSATLTGLAVRTYFFLAFNIFLQVFLLSVLNEELRLYNPIKGRVHLCDFGSNIAMCPGAANCLGPGGTEYSWPRLYSFTMWSLRSFTRDSLEALFPERAQDIGKVVDPGEYGVEDYYCRVACILIFVMAVTSDLSGTMGLWYLLHQVPTKAETWIRYDHPTWAPKDEAKAIHGWSELDLVKFMVAGMPFHWKIINFAIVVVPKTFIWLVLVCTGIDFLMETPGIIDLVVNCIALTFILDIDEAVFQKLATVSSKHMMNKLEDMNLYETEAEEEETEQEAVRRFYNMEFGSSLRGKMKLIGMLVPMRLVYVVVVMMMFLSNYYYRNCVRSEDGGWVSKDLYSPVGMGAYNPLNFLIPGLIQVAEQPTWVMPTD